jgi:hypothetical protein
MNLGAETVPDNFKKIITDFVSSFLTTFPEYADGMQSFTGCATHSHDSMTDDAVARLLAHCKAVYPERFFDILYQNDNIFSPDAAVSNNALVEFLPGIDFRIVWNMSDITDTTKERIWKHLQLITFTIVGSMSPGNLTFGDTAKLFEAINEEELRVKLEETMANLQSMFDSGAGASNASESNGSGSGSGNTGTADNSDGASGSSCPRSGSGVPDAEKMHEHLSGLLDGKIGALAKEIAEETVKELDIDVSEESSVSGVFQKLMKNPGKLAGIVKKVGEKLDKKMKSGDIKESELFKEASDFMTKMKGSGGKGGMGDIAQMLKSMNLNMGDLAGFGGGGAGGGKTKVNLGAMQSQLGRNFKMAQNKERMQKKLEEHRAAAAAAAAAAEKQQQQQLKQMKHSVYQAADGGRIEKTPRVPAVEQHISATVTTGNDSLSEPAVITSSGESVKKKKKNKNKK